MKSIDSWALLRSGNIDEGLAQMKEVYCQKPIPSHIMELGVAYLWVQMYEAAWNHFSAAIRSYPQSMSSFYGMAGAAKWCLGDFDEGVRQWTAGLKAAFSDTAGLGIRLPLLLFLASALKPERFQRDMAQEILIRKTVDSRITRWPGPIVEWLLGRLNEADFQKQCGDGDQSQTNSRKWLAEFYKALHDYSASNAPAFRETMRILTDTSQPEWSDKQFFLARMWNEEFFIARREAEEGSVKNCS